MNLKKKLITGLMCTMMLSATILPNNSNAIAKSYDGETRVATALLSDGITRASWGEGELICKNSLLGKPQGYAKTSTFAGTAYKLTAKVIIVDNNGGIDSSATKTETNSSSAISATLVSKTASCEFLGKHEIQDTKSSGWQFADTSVTY